MSDKRREQILQKAVRVYGKISQMLMMIEEMSELTKAISKYHRAVDGESAMSAAENILEEMADVQIMLDQMRIMFGSTDEWERKKLDRLEKRIEAEQTKGEKRNE